jgi:hypothetical protein
MESSLLRSSCMAATVFVHSSSPLKSGDVHLSNFMVAVAVAVAVARQICKYNRSRPDGRWYILFAEAAAPQ